MIAFLPLFRFSVRYGSGMVGRKPVDQTTEPVEGFVTAIKGQAGRLSAPPPGDKYVRDPVAARAKAIRERVAMYKGQKLAVPEHLQALYDQLPPEDADSDCEVELVDEVTGDHVAEVELDEGEPQPSGTASGTSTGVYRSREQEPEAQPEPPEPLAASASSAANVTAQAGPLAEAALGATGGGVTSATAEPVVPDVVIPEIKFTDPGTSPAATRDAQAAAIARAAGEPEPPKPGPVKKAAPRKRR